MYINVHGYKKLEKALADLKAREIPAATAGYLNSQAFRSKEIALEEIEDTMTVRSPRFVKSRLRVNKTKYSKNLSSMYARMGSIVSDRFDGWATQERGDTPHKNRASTTAARPGGNLNRVMRRKLRLHPGTKIPRISKVRGIAKIEDPDRRIAAGISRLRRAGYTGLFKIDEGDSALWMPGVYMIKGRKVKLVHMSSPKKPSKNRWMGRTVAAMNKEDRYKLWRKVAAFLVEKRKTFR